MEEGDHSFSLNLAHDETDQVVAAFSGTINSKGRKGGSELVMRISDAVFHSAGVYNLTLNLGGAPAGSRTLTVDRIEDGGNT